MYIHGDTHYWPIRFIDKVSHPGKGYVEEKKDNSDFMFASANGCRATSLPTIGTAPRSILSRKDDEIWSCAQSL